MSDKKSPWDKGFGDKGSGKNGSGSGGAGDNKNPWGGSGGGSGKPDRSRPKASDTSPDLENVINRLKEKVSGGGHKGGNFGFGGGGGNKGSGLMARLGPLGIATLVLGIYLLFTSVYMIDQNEEGVILRFGEYSRTTEPGLHLKFPNPVEEVLVVDVTSERNIPIGVSSDNLMLTGDENIARIAYTVLWRVSNSAEFMFNVDDVPGTVRDVAESAMREVVGKTELEPLITDERDAVAADVQTLMQEMLDEYRAGVLVSQVELKESQEPREVEDAFLQVVAAKQEAEQAILRAREKENELIPKANADADRLIQEARGYKEAVIAEARGDAARFDSVYEEYKQAPRVTRQRMYLETMEHVYGPATKIIMDDGAGTGVVPYLPLDQLSNRPSSNASSNGGK